MSKCHICDNNNKDLYIYNDNIICHTCLGDELISEALFFSWVLRFEEEC